MGRVRHGVEKGFDIFLENSDTKVSWLAGTAAPTGLGEQADASIGSIYQRINTGELYIKEANAGEADDYVRVTTSNVLTLWRPENVDIVTNDTQAAGTRDVIASPFSDDDDGLVAADFTVGNYVIVDADGTPSILEITNVSGDDVTFAAATALSSGDAFITKKYLPDVAGQENRALVVFNGSIVVKLADIDWNFATGISLSSGFTKTNGTVTSSDTVESSIEKLAANQEDLTTLSGVAQGSTSNGTFTGSTLSDSTTKVNLQELETFSEGNRADIDDLRTLSGTVDGDVDHGTMDGGDILSDDETTNALFKEVDGELTRQRGKVLSSGVTTLATVDSVLVDSVSGVQWHIVIENTASPANKKRLVVDAFHDGTASADATSIDNDVSSSKRIGSSFNTVVSVDISGAAAAQVIRLRVSSTEPSGVNVYAKRIETLF